MKRKSKKLPVWARLREKFHQLCDDVTESIKQFEPRTGFDFARLYGKWVKRLKAEFDRFMAQDLTPEQWSEKYR